MFMASRNDRWVSAHHVLLIQCNIALVAHAYCFTCRRNPPFDSTSTDGIQSRQEIIHSTAGKMMSQSHSCAISRIMTLICDLFSLRIISCTYALVSASYTDVPCPFLCGSFGCRATAHRLTHSLPGRISI